MNFQYFSIAERCLTLIWVGVLRVRFVVGEIKLPPFLKVVRIMLKTWHLHTYVVSENISFSAKSTLILLILHTPMATPQKKFSLRHAECPSLEDGNLDKYKKHELLNALEKLLDTLDYQFDKGEATRWAVVVNFMPMIRKIGFEKYPGIRDGLKRTRTSILVEINANLTSSDISFT